MQPSAPERRVSLLPMPGRGDARPLDLGVQHAGEVEIVDVLGLAKSVQAAVGPLCPLTDGGGLLAGFRDQDLKGQGHERRF